MSIKELMLKDAHYEFEEYYLRYCAENNIDLQSLKQDNEQKVDEIFVQVTNTKNELIHKPLQEEKKIKNKSI